MVLDLNQNSGFSHALLVLTYVLPISFCLPEPPLVEAAELEVELVAEPFCSSANLTFRTVEFPEAFPFPFPVKYCEIIQAGVSKLILKRLHTPLHYQKLIMSMILILLS